MVNWSPAQYEDWTICDNCHNVDNFMTFMLTMMINHGQKPYLERCRYSQETVSVRLLFSRLGLLLTSTVGAGKHQY